MSRLLFAYSCAALLMVSSGGCTGGSNSKVEEKQEKKGIFGKKTQEIGKFDANAPQEISDQKIRATDPVTAPLAAYGPMMERVSMLAIDHAVNLFQATEGRYPKDYDEFMEKIIKANNIQLPVLPYGGKYQYDETTHGLVIVRPRPEDKNNGAAQPEGGAAPNK
ncbi:MAG: hypothetical protein ACKV0T_17725 [Planctomycetales bacterium]